MTHLGGAVSGAALERCIACGPDTFATQYWGRRPLLTRAAELGSGFADLLDAAAVDELVSRRGLRTPFLRMAKDGAVLAPAKFTRGGGAGASVSDQAADDRVLAMVGEGATLVLQALHRTWPPLVGFASSLAAELGHPVQVNAYVTPPQNQGFAPHYDVHDVFVLQVTGRKRWVIHEPVITDPLPDQRWEKRRDTVAARAQDEPVIDTELAPGDALYLPRGTIHAAVALGETSIHLTVGIHPVTRYELARRLLDAAQEDANLRTSLPMGTDLTDPDVLAPHLAATVAALKDYLDSASPDEIAIAIGDLLMRDTRPEPLAPLAQLAAADALGPRTSLRLRTGLRPRVTRDDEHVTLTLLDKTITLPPDSSDALKAVLAGAVFSPAELPGLDADEQLALAGRLLREGVIVPG
jgi:bifunctional lysine-specific demethylase and histidyl-hydroxylase NO66